MTFQDPYIELEAVAQLKYRMWLDETQRTTLGELRPLSGNKPIRVSRHPRGPLGRLWNPEAYDSDRPALIVDGVFVEDTFAPYFDIHLKGELCPAVVAYERVESVDWMQRAPRAGAGCHAYRRAIFMESAGYPQFVAFDLTLESRILQYMPTLCDSAGHTWESLGNLSPPRTLLGVEVRACRYCGSFLIAEGRSGAVWERCWIHEPTPASVRWAALQHLLQAHIPEFAGEGRPFGKQFARWLRARGHDAETRAWQDRVYVHMLEHRAIHHRVSSRARAVLDTLWHTFSLESKLDC
ncbi:MAG: hypothetical protein ACQETK_05650 [Pseudomonadota bacterium]